MDREIRSDSCPHTQRSGVAPFVAPAQRHLVGTIIGMGAGGVIVSAITALLLGSIESLIGLFVGIIAGGFIGKSVAALLNPSIDASLWNGRYRVATSHESSHFITNPTDDEEVVESRQAVREAWNHLEESNKELIQGPLAPDDHKLDNETSQ